MNIKVGNKLIGDDKPVFIVAELSGNHNYNFNIAVKTLEAMKKAGADAVKVQTYTADTITINSNSSYFQIKHGTLWDGQTLYNLYQKAYTPWEWQPKLQKIARKIGLIFFSTPFDFTAVNFLEKMKVPAYKIASYEANDLPLIRYVAKKGKPVIISTGMSTLSEIGEAVNTCKKVGNNKVIILKCTSLYPAPFQEVNLRTIPDLIKKFKTIVGLSDHTLGISVPVAAVVLGAKVIEKHFILDKNLGGVDAEFSAEPEEFKTMVKTIRETELALGGVTYRLSKESLKSKVFQRSLFVVKDIKQGDKYTNENVRSIRPGYGLAPKYIDIVLGRKARTNIKRGTPLAWKLIVD